MQRQPAGWAGSEDDERLVNPGGRFDGAPPVPRGASFSAASYSRGYANVNHTFYFSGREFSLSFWA